MLITGRSWTRRLTVITNTLVNHLESIVQYVVTIVTAKGAPWMPIKSCCEIAARDILAMTDELELNWEDLTTPCIDEKGLPLPGEEGEIRKKKPSEYSF